MQEEIGSGLVRSTAAPAALLVYLNLLRYVESIHGLRGCDGEGELVVVVDQDIGETWCEARWAVLLLSGTVDPGLENPQPCRVDGCRAVVITYALMHRRGRRFKRMRMRARIVILDYLAA